MLQGQAEVERNLKNVLKIVAESKEKALHEVGQRGVGIVKQNTPVDTGRLRNNMGYSIGNKAVGSNDAVKASGDPNTVNIGTNVVYAAYVEYMAKNGSQGYMQRSFNQLLPIAKAIFKDVFKRGLK
jgi:hypothetical protein